MTDAAASPAGRRAPLVWTAAATAALAIAVTLFALAAQRAPDAHAHVAPPADDARLSADSVARHPEAVLVPALSEIYAAFGEIEEGRIYDRLAAAAAGEALESLYLQRRAALADTGLDAGAQSVHGVELIAVQARRVGQGIEARARWRVIGSVGHADHTHLRGAAFEADLALAPVAGRWRLTDFTLTGVDRSEAGTDAGGHR